MFFPEFIILAHLLLALLHGRGVLIVISAQIHVFIKPESDLHGIRLLSKLPLSLHSLQRGVWARVYNSSAFKKLLSKVELTQACVSPDNDLPLENC